jgi:hypothetical protein
MSLFFFLFFGAIDLGRLVFSFVTAEKAAQMAVRMAIVRPPVCLNVPDRHTRGTAVNGPRFGTSCKAVAGACAIVATPTCVGSAADPTSVEIWARIQPLLSPAAQIDNLQFTYTSDPNLGFLGGPYTPMVTVDLILPAFQFISPLGALATAAGAANPGNLGSNLIYPAFSVSLPAEDLALGDAG